MKSLVYETEKYVYNFQQYETTSSFAKENLAGKITLDNADKDQSDLLIYLKDFKKETKRKYI